MTELPIMLKQGHPVHRPHENRDEHNPMIEGRVVQPRSHKAHGCAPRDVLNELLHEDTI